MAKQQGKIMRMDIKFFTDLKIIPVERIRNGTENEAITFKEVTRMATNADSWQQLLKELKTKPRRPKQNGIF